MRSHRMIVPSVVVVLVAWVTSIQVPAGGWADSAAVQKILGCKIEGIGLDMSPDEAKAVLAQKGYEFKLTADGMPQGSLRRDGARYVVTLTSEGDVLRTIALVKQAGGLGATVDSAASIAELKQCLGEANCITDEHCLWRDTEGDEFVVQYTYESDQMFETYKVQLNPHRKFGPP